MQPYVVHQVRGTLSKRVLDRDEITADLRDIYQANTYDEEEQAFEAFKQKWQKKYKREVKSWEDDVGVLLTFLKYPVRIKKYLYTTNMIERPMKEIRKRLKTMNSLPSIEAVEKIVFLVSKATTMPGPQKTQLV